MSIHLQSPGSHSQIRNTQPLQVHPLGGDPISFLPLHKPGQSAGPPVRPQRALTGRDWKRRMANCSLQKETGTHQGQRVMPGAVAESMQDAPPPEPGVPLCEGVGECLPHAAPPTDGGCGSLREEGCSTYFRMTRLAAWMACSNLGERRIPCSPLPPTAHHPLLVHKAWGQGSGQWKGEVRRRLTLKGAQVLEGMR